MKSVKKILKYQGRIIKLCKAAGDYIKIDDLAIGCFAGPSARNRNFMHAWEDLVASGRLEICGNSLRIRL